MCTQRQKIHADIQRFLVLHHSVRYNQTFEYGTVYNIVTNILLKELKELYTKYITKRTVYKKNTFHVSIDDIIKLLLNTVKSIRLSYYLILNNVVLKPYLCMVQYSVLKAAPFYKKKILCHNFS